MECQCGDVLVVVGVSAADIAAYILLQNSTLGRLGTPFGLFTDTETDSPAGQTEYEVCPGPMSLTLGDCRAEGY